MFPGRRSRIATSAQTQYRLPNRRGFLLAAMPNVRGCVILGSSVLHAGAVLRATRRLLGLTNLSASTARQLRCLIIDDSPEFVEAARRLLDKGGITVVGVGASSDDAVRLADQLRPDVTLIDMDLGEEDGIAVTRLLAQLESSAAGKIILISTYAEDDIAELVEASAATGFVPKSSLSADAIQALTDTDRERNP